MAKHPTSSRVHRDKNLPDDPFVSGIERSLEWARTHTRILIVAAVALAVLIAAGLYYLNVQRSIENTAAQRFNELQGTLASGNTQLALRDLQSFVDQFGGTESGEQARLILADVLLQEDRAPEVIPALDGLEDDLDEPQGLAAARLAAAAYEATGDADEAVDTYFRIAEDARFDFERRDALADAARVRLQNGEAEEAAEIYQQIVEMFDEGESGRGYFEMWRAEAQAQARQPTDGAPAAADAESDNG